MRIPLALLPLPLAATLALLAACKGGATPSGGVVQVRDLPLTHISAGEATQALQDKLGGDATISPNLRNNSVIVTGTAEQVGRAEELVRQIDVPRE